MDRARWWPCWDRHAKPHARGDGPRTMVAVLGSTCQAPRTWGWTGSWNRLGRPPWPSPTHVGMDRFLNVVRAWRRGLGWGLGGAIHHVPDQGGGGLMVIWRTRVLDMSLSHTARQPGWRSTSVYPWGALNPSSIPLRSWAVNPSYSRTRRIGIAYPTFLPSRAR